MDVQVHKKEKPNCGTSLCSGQALNMKNQVQKLKRKQ